MQQLSQEVAAYLGVDLGKIKIKRFADGEIYVQVGQAARAVSRSTRARRASCCCCFGCE
jgi:phosphoribosylpyrophosphate synthetase